MTFKPNLRKPKIKKDPKYKLQPILYVEVELQSESKQLVLNQGDNSDEVVHMFAELNSLDEE
jgi:hypothetical protein